MIALLMSYTESLKGRQCLRDWRQECLEKFLGNSRELGTKIIMFIRECAVVALRGKVGCLMHRGVASVVVQMNVTC
jgi:hypothetical protein